MSKLIAIMIDKMNQHAVGKGNTKIFSSAKTTKHVWILALRMFWYGTEPNKPEELNWNHSLLLFSIDEVYLQISDTQTPIVWLIGGTSETTCLQTKNNL